MDHSGSITMSMRELGRIKIIQSVIDGLLIPWRAAEQLELSVRQVERLCLRYRHEGPAGLISRKRAHPSNHQLAPGVAARALALVAKRYPDFGPTFACEKLREAHGFDLSVATVRRLMTAAGFWVPRKLRPPKVHQPRNRRACLGELVQIDGSDHRWFEERGPSCTLLVFIDDATSRLMTLHFTQTESTFSYFEALDHYLAAHGKPVALYSDKFSVFRVNANNYEEKTFGKGITQFGRACFELNIDTWCANSSQAKGRVERANLTLQDRLVKEMRLRGINTQEAANAYAPSFIADFTRSPGNGPSFGRVIFLIGIGINRSPMGMPSCVKKQSASSNHATLAPRSPTITGRIQIAKDIGHAECCITSGYRPGLGVCGFCHRNLHAQIC